MYYGQIRMQVGVLQFGQGKVYTDGSIPGAKLVAAPTSSSASLEGKIKVLNWRRGITSMAQAFNFAGRMVRECGSEDARASVRVITDGKPSVISVTSRRVDQPKETSA